MKTLLPVFAFLLLAASLSAQENSAYERTSEKLFSIILPKIETKGATLREVVKFLETKSAEFDTQDTNPATKGIKFVLKFDAPASPPAADAPRPQPDNPMINLSLRYIPVGEILHYATEVTGTRAEIDGDTVVILPRTAKGGANARPVEYLPPLPPDGHEETLEHKFDQIIVPEMQFKEATVAEAVTWLGKEAVRLDTEESNPARKGVNIVVAPDPNPPAGSPRSIDTKISLTLRNISVTEALRYTAELSGMQLRFDPYADVLYNPVLIPGKPRPAPPLVPPPITPGETVEHYLKNNTQLLTNLGLDGDPDKQPPNPGPGPNTVALANLRFKLQNIIFPRVEFREATVNEALAWLRYRSREFDTVEKDPAKKGVNLLVSIYPLPKADNPWPASAKITLSLENIPLGDVVTRVAAAAGMQVRYDPRAVVFTLRTPEP